MTALELPHVSVLSKCDLLPSRVALDDFLEADTSTLADRLHSGTRPQFYKLNGAICGLIEEWNVTPAGLVPAAPRRPCVPAAFV